MSLHKPTSSSLFGFLFCGILSSCILSSSASPVERRYEISPRSTTNLSVPSTKGINGSIEVCSPINGTIEPEIDWSFLAISKQCNESERAPFALDEFQERRRRLVKQLKVDRKGEDWGVWLDALRFPTWTQPYVFAIAPKSKHTDEPSISWLIPFAEFDRITTGARLSVANNTQDVHFVFYSPYDDPYEVMYRHLQKLHKAYGGKSKRWTAQLAGMSVATAEGFFEAIGNGGDGPVHPRYDSQAIKNLRSIKSAHEIEVMRCANRVTIKALRAVREHLVLNITEANAAKLISDALNATGMYDIRARRILFGWHAGRHPYGRTYRSVTLQEGDFALFQVGAKYKNYETDITRTMMPDLASGLRAYKNESQQAAWEAVRHAQERGLAKMASNTSLTIADVDHATRYKIRKAGFGKQFTTRVGHGVGLEPDETPSITPRNKARLFNNVAFTLEPAIYNNDFGVKLGDPVLKTRHGYELISGEPLAQSPWEP